MKSLDCVIARSVSDAAIYGLLRSARNDVRAGVSKELCFDRCQVAAE